MAATPSSRQPSTAGESDDGRPPREGRSPRRRSRGRRCGRRAASSGRRSARTMPSARGRTPRINRIVAGELADRGDEVQGGERQRDRGGDRDRDRQLAAARGRPARGDVPAPTTRMSSPRPIAQPRVVERPGVVRPVLVGGYRRGGRRSVGREVLRRDGVEARDRSSYARIPEILDRRLVDLLRRLRQRSIDRSTAIAIIPGWMPCWMRGAPRRDIGDDDPVLSTTSR